MNEPTKVTYIPAICERCGKQLAMIAVAPMMKGQRIYITVSPNTHDCKPTGESDGVEVEA
jgi:hypothetical protein